MAVGVQAVMDLVFKASIVMAQQSLPWARPSDCLPASRGTAALQPITCQL